MLIRFNSRNFLIGTFIIFGFLIPSKEGIPSQTLKQTRQRSNLSFNSIPSFISLPKQVRDKPLLKGRLSEGLLFLDCINRVDAQFNANRVIAQDSLRADTTVRKPVEKKFRMKKSPWVAVGLSALLPGAGQFYNKSYWKVPVILGFVGYLAYEFYDNDKKYRDYRDQYSATQTPENPTGDENLKALRQFYFDQRNDFVWYFTIVYVINLIDAYVDAHLFDFDVREEKLTRFGKTDKEYKLKFKINF